MGRASNREHGGHVLFRQGLRAAKDGGGFLPVRDAGKWRPVRIIDAVDAGETAASECGSLRALIDDQQRLRIDAADVVISQTFLIRHAAAATFAHAVEAALVAAFRIVRAGIADRFAGDADASVLVCRRCIPPPRRTPRWMDRGLQFAGSCRHRSDTRIHSNLASSNRRRRPGCSTALLVRSGRPVWN